MKTVPPQYLSISFSLPFDVAKQPFRLDTNWSVDTTAPGLRTPFLSPPSLDGLTRFDVASSVRRFCLPDWQAEHFGRGHDFVSAYFVGKTAFSSPSRTRVIF